MKILEVNRSFYIFNIVLILIMVLAVLFQAKSYLQIGDQMYSQSWFLSWYIFAAGFSIIAGLAFCRYLYFKEYRTAFYTSVASIFLAMIHYFVVLKMLAGQQMVEYYSMSYIIGVASGLPMALSLILSKAGARPNLKIAGVLVFIFNLSMIILYTWGINSVNLELTAQLRTIQIWVSNGANIVYLFFILNFLNEMKELKNSKHVDSPDELNLSHT